MTASRNNEEFYIQLEAETSDAKDLRESAKSLRESLETFRNRYEASDSQNKVIQSLRKIEVSSVSNMEKALQDMAKAYDDLKTDITARNKPDVAPIFGRIVNKSVTFINHARDFTIKGIDIEKEMHPTVENPSKSSSRDIITQEDRSGNSPKNYCKRLAAGVGSLSITMARNTVRAFSWGAEILVMGASTIITSGYGGTDPKGKIVNAADKKIDTYLSADKSDQLLDYAKTGQLKSLDEIKQQRDNKEKLSPSNIGSLQTAIDPKTAEISKPSGPKK